MESTYALPSLVAGYRDELNRASLYLETLGEIETRVAAAAEAASYLRPLSGRVRAAALELRELLERRAYGEARRVAENLCRATASEFAKRLYGMHSIDEDACPEQNVVKLAASMLDAAGPLRPLVQSLVSAGTGSLQAFAERVLEVARAWSTVAQHLTDVYAAAARLEKLMGVSRTSLIAGVASLLSEEEKPLNALAALADELGTAAGIAQTLSEMLGEVSPALQLCGSRGRLYCRWLGDAVAELAAAREQLEAALRASSLDALRRGVDKAADHVRSAKSLAAMVLRLAKRLAPDMGGDTLADAVKALEEAYNSYGLTEREEKLLEQLVRDGAVELTSLEDQDLVAAGLRLCRRRLVRCTLRL